MLCKVCNHFKINDSLSFLFIFYFPLEFARGSSKDFDIDNQVPDDLEACVGQNVSERFSGENLVNLLML